MNFYFYSDLNACLKINGEYSGGVSKNVSATNLSEKGDFLFEFLPNFCLVTGRREAAKYPLTNF